MGNFQVEFLKQSLVKYKKFRNNNEAGSSYIAVIVVQNLVSKI